MMMAHTTPIPPQGLTEIIKAPPLLDVEPEEPIVTSQVEPAPELPLLHDLMPLDRLLITKKLRVRNVIFLKGKRSRYMVRTADETLVYHIEEENNWWASYFCYGLRPVQLTVSNRLGTEIMRMQRPFSCTIRFLPCQLQRMDVYSPPDQLLGSVEQQWSAIKPLYLVKNGNGDQKFWLRGPFNTVSCFCDVQFEIMRADGTPVGATCKRWQGLNHALFFAPVQDNFGVAFESSLSVEEKGLLLAATLLMDFMYYDA